MASGFHILIVEARFYDDIQDALLEGALVELKAAGVTHEIITVPGALGIPAAIAIDGVSMTVNEVSGRQFGVNVIPITQRETTLGEIAAGGRVNLEIDMMARYVARLMAKDVE